MKEQIMKSEIWRDSLGYEGQLYITTLFFGCQAFFEKFFKFIYIFQFIYINRMEF